MLPFLYHSLSIIFQHWFPNNLQARSFYTVTNYTNFPKKFTRINLIVIFFTYHFYSVVNNELQNDQSQRSPQHSKKLAICHIYFFILLNRYLNHLLLFLMFSLGKLLCLKSDE